MRGIALILLAVFGAVGLAACTSLGPAEEQEIREMIRLELTAAIADVKQGPAGEQGPQGEPGSTATDETLLVLINEVIVSRLEELRGPSGAQGVRGIQGPQGEPGSISTEETMLVLINEVIVSRLEELRGPAGEQGVQGIQGPQGVPGTTDPSSDSTIDTRISSLEAMIGTLESSIAVNTLNINDLHDDLARDVDALWNEIFAIEATIYP